MHNKGRHRRPEEDANQVSRGGKYVVGIRNRLDDNDSRLETAKKKKKKEERERAVNLKLY